jgi:hypothetical protein
MNLLESSTNLFKNNLEIMRAKNADYSGNVDDLKNFRLSAETANISIQQGILVRLMDKMARIGNLLQKDPEVKSESINDTISDAVNYLAILNYSLEKK